VADLIFAMRREGDRVVVSMHWGSNWGYEVARQKKSFARRLIDAGAADLVHGHSSHHPRPLEIYRERLILYGCGDFLNDYEGIAGHESFRPELALMFYPTLEASTGRLAQLTLTPVRIRRFRLQRASDEEAGWLTALLGAESRIPVERLPDGRLRVR
jgi:poly-gamma-glutamate synthesis protein (capsule biosynthesis protein)